MQQKKKKVNKKTTISYVCRYAVGNIIKKCGRTIADIPIPVVETLAFWNAVKQAIYENYSKVIVESDPLIAIQALNGKSVPPLHICNLVEDIIMLAQEVDNINFVSCRRSANKLADRIAKKDLSCLYYLKLSSINLVVVKKKKRKKEGLLKYINFH